jgi:hypothetical protein
MIINDVKLSPLVKINISVILNCFGINPTDENIKKFILGHKMTKHCSTIVPPSNFPSEFSYGKRHNISLKESSEEDSQISSNDETSLNNNII